MKVGLLTVSDTCSRQAVKDVTGPLLKELIQVAEYGIIPDDVEAIQKQLIEWTDSLGLDVILTTGGTGCSPTDVTPEATKKVIEKEVPGLSIAMLFQSLNSVPMSMLSRSVCGIRKKTLIINLPGNPQGAVDCFKVVFPVLQHSVDLMNNNEALIEKVHIDIHQENKYARRIHVPHLFEANIHDMQLGNHHSYRCDHHPFDHHVQHHHYRFHHHHRHSNHHGSSNETESISSIVNENQVALRQRKSKYLAVSVEDALEIVLRESLVEEVEPVPYDQCLHRIIASKVLADSSLPPFSASIKDGYAVIAADGAGLREVIGGVTAGSIMLKSIERGQCYRISTGAAIPPGADAVVQVEDTILVEASCDGKEELRVEILVAPLLGQDIRRTGCDIELKECILEPGTRISPSDIGLLASVGNMSIDCFKLPSIGILSTGSELVEPESILRSGKIRDSNRPMLLSALREQGFQATDLGVAVDKATTLLSCFKMALDVVDVIISTGGVSMGEKDLVKDVLTEDLQATIHFGRVFMKPGKPTTFATFQYKNQKKYFFGLPGNPVSALVTFHLFVLPSLRKMGGHHQPDSTIIKAKLATSVKLDERPEYHRCTLDWSTSADGIPIASSTGNQMSSRLLSVKSATGFLKLPAKSGADNVQVLEEGSLVECIHFIKI